jgi:hypothetical protein
MCAAYPYLLQAGFEASALSTPTTGDIAETDTTSAGAIYHYTDLVSTHGFLPWRGSFCYVIDESICTTTECKLVSAGCNVQATYFWSMGFAFYAKSTTMAAGNRTSLVKLLNGTTEEVCLQLYYTAAGGLQLLLTEANDTAVGSNPAWGITENEWHWIELYGVNDPGSNDGTAYCVMDGLAVGNIGSLNQLAFTDMQIGLDDQDAGHTAGIYAFDDILFSGEDTSAVRIGMRERYPMNPHISAVGTSYSEHIFVGPGTVADVTLLTTASGDFIRLYDTDIGYSTGSYGARLVCEVNEANSATIATGPFRFNRGCLAVIGVAASRGIIRIDQDPPCGYPSAIYYGFPANLKRYAISHRPKFTQ